MNDMLHQVEALIPALRRYARALVRNRAAADDLVQNCLERAVSRWHQRREADARSWLSPFCITSPSISFAARPRAASM
jgi:DNA-directed RNA polymerase specialized sigma24 family protein